MSGNGIHHLQNLIQTKDTINKELLSMVLTKCNDLEDRVKMLEGKLEKIESKKSKKWHWVLGISAAGLAGLFSIFYNDQPKKNIYF